MKPRKAELNKSLRKWVHILGLESWDISIDWSEKLDGDDSAIAEVCRYPESKHADILVLDTVNEDPVLLDACVCHECLHVALAPLRGAIENVLEHGILNEQVRELAEDFLTKAEDAVVYGLEYSMTRSAK